MFHVKHRGGFRRFCVPLPPQTAFRACLSDFIFPVDSAARLDIAGAAIAKRW
jgi:hypothetical protein